MFNYVKSQLMDPGQVHYLVDSDFRTVAQGWARPDGTGPLDLWAHRNPGYVYRTGEYANDRTAMQAAIDAMVDFRGDTLFFPPASLSLGTTALAFDVPNARYLGPKVSNPKSSRVILTDTLGDHVLSVDDVEFAYLTFVPLTAQNWFSVSDGADRGYVHNCYYNALGVAASTSTEWFNAAATTVDWEVADCDTIVDAAQGDLFTIAAAVRWKWYNMKMYVRGGTWASIFTFTGASRGNLADLLHTIADGGSSLITNVFTGATGANMLTASRVYMHGTATPTAGNIETGFDGTTGIDIAECYRTSDETVAGGVLITLT